MDRTEKMDRTENVELTVLCLKRELGETARWTPKSDFPQKGLPIV